jgi:hypothetical protein
MIPMSDTAPRPQLHQPPHRKFRNAYATIVAAVIGPLVTAGVGVFVGGHYLGTAQHPSPAVTVTVPAKPTTAKLTFALAQRSKVSWCQTYYGTGTIPRDDVLAIFTTPAQPDGQPAVIPYYSFNAIGQQYAPNHWRTEPLQIGAKPGTTRSAAHFPADIVAVLVSRPMFDYVQSIIPLHWWSHVPLPGQKISLSVITNGRRGMNCT